MKKPDNVSKADWEAYQRVNKIIGSIGGSKAAPRPKEYYQAIANKRWDQYRKAKQDQD